MKLQSFFHHLSSAQGLNNFKKTIPFALFLFFQRSPSVPSSSQTSQTEPSAPPLRVSNEAITVMAYVKAMGGVANIPAKNLIVNSNLLALETVSRNDGNMKLVTISGDQVIVTDEVFGPPSSTADKTTVYNVSDLLREYWQTQDQQEKINNLLAQGTRHNLMISLLICKCGGKGTLQHRTWK